MGSAHDPYRWAPPVVPPPPPGVVPSVSPSRRRWPFAIAGLAGLVAGIVLGVLLLAVTLVIFGKPRQVADSTGDPNAAWDLSATLTDAFLTSRVRANAARPVQDPRVHVQADGRIALEGRVGVRGPAVPVTVLLQPSIGDGQVRVALVSVKVGGLPLPGPLVEQIERVVTEASQPPMPPVPLTIVRIETMDGQLIVYSKLKQEP